MIVRRSETGPDAPVRVVFVSGVSLLFLALLPRDPLMAGTGLLMVALPLLHRLATSPGPGAPGRRRTRLLAALYAAWWAGILLGLGGAARHLIAAFGA